MRVMVNSSVPSATLDVLKPRAFSIRTNYIIRN